MIKPERASLASALSSSIPAEVATVIQEQLGAFLTDVSREDLSLLLFYNQRLAEARRVGDAQRIALSQGRLDRLIENIQFQFQGVAEGIWDKVEPIFIKALEVILTVAIKAVIPV